MDEIFDDDVAKTFGIEKDQITVMIHTGSRGCGHQICSDYLRTMDKAYKKYNINLPDRQLACAPVDSPEAQDYFGAMAAAANYAWTNRQMIVHWVRVSFEQVFKRDAEDMNMGIVYDVAHNIAKKETHKIKGRDTEVYVHKKGATRAFGPEESKFLQSTGVSDSQLCYLEQWNSFVHTSWNRNCNGRNIWSNSSWCRT